MLLLPPPQKRNRSWWESATIQGATRENYFLRIWERTPKLHRMLWLPGKAGPVRRNACGCASVEQQGSVCWKLFSKCLLFCMRLYSCFMLYRICSRRKTVKELNLNLNFSISLNFISTRTSNADDQEMLTTPKPPGMVTFYPGHKANNETNWEA